ncbi:fungal-specific transcription factor domain-containing protein [Mycena olivaceomarginata]|nr:fungal-specific transcription factor domain-containing protein [Mycena olivaceomarginata]
MSSSTTDAPLSRMREHRGNVPILPKTKILHTVPSQVHENSALEPAPPLACELCESAEFTRSDLLMRHKRTCGQSLNRLRKKSCEACTESKVKCNLQYPCAKCTSRGRQCVFRNNPVASRNRSCRERRRSTSLPPSTECSALPSPKIHSLSSGWASPATSSSSSSSSHTLNLPALSESGSSPRSEGFQPFDDSEQHLAFPLDVGGLDVGGQDAPLDLTLCSFPTEFDDAILLNPSTEPDAFSLAMPQPMDPFASLIRFPSPAPSPPPVLPLLPPSILQIPTLTLDYVDPQDMQLLFGASGATTMDMYLQCFFTRFLPQAPLIHAPTWKITDTPPILARVFHACGAVFVRTREAAAFVEGSVEALTTDISEEIRMLTDTSQHSHSIHLIMALVLLQTISLFRRDREGAGGGMSASSAQQHAMLVAMIRQTGLIQRVAAWTAPDYSNPMAWAEWAQFEMIKRTLLFAYVHDCCHCMYSAASPAFSPAELNVPLPCDDALWRAPRAAAWLAAAAPLASLATPPPPNTMPNRPTPLALALPLSSFGLFILIHTVLRNICVAQRPPPGGPGWSSSSHSASHLSSMSYHAPASCAEFAWKTQVVLDNWLQIWRESPEAQAGATQGLPFVCNSSPFYWLAQVSLWNNSCSAPAAGPAGFYLPFA